MAFDLNKYVTLPDVSVGLDKDNMKDILFGIIAVFIFLIFFYFFIKHLLK